MLIPTQSAPRPPTVNTAARVDVPVRSPEGARRALALLASAGLAAVASADVVLYAASRSVSYTQTSNAAPVTPDSWLFVAVAHSDLPDEILASDVLFVRPPMVQFPLYRATENSWFYYSTLYATEAELLADYPATTYTIQVDRGFGIESGDLDLPADGYCAEIPAFTGDTFDRLEYFDPSQDFVGTINGFTPYPGTNAAAIAVVVTQNGFAGPVWQAELLPSETAFTIPAGTLASGTGSAISIQYLNATLVQGAGFGGSAVSDVEYARGTAAAFVTIPHCRADITTGAIPGVYGYGVRNGVLNNEDFFYYLTQFAGGNLGVADMTTGAIAGQAGYGIPNGILNNDDFFFYLTIFAAGC